LFDTSKQIEDWGYNTKVFCAGNGVDKAYCEQSKLQYNIFPGLSKHSVALVGMALIPETLKPSKKTTRRMKK